MLHKYTDLIKLLALVERQTITFSSKGFATLLSCTFFPWRVSCSKEDHRDLHAAKLWVLRCNWSNKHVKKLSVKEILESWKIWDCSCIKRTVSSCTNVALSSKSPAIFKVFLKVRIFFNGVCFLIRASLTDSHIIYTYSHFSINLLQAISYQMPWWKQPSLRYDNIKIKVVFCV